MRRNMRRLAKATSSQGAGSSNFPGNPSSLNNPENTPMLRVAQSRASSLTTMMTSLKPSSTASLQQSFLDLSSRITSRRLSQTKRKLADMSQKTIARRIAHGFNISCDPSSTSDTQKKSVSPRNITSVHFAGLLPPCPDERRLHMDVLARL